MVLTSRRSDSARHRFREPSRDSGPDSPRGRYRLIDTAENYRNEDAVGQAIRDSGIIVRVFITTKFNRRWHSVDGVVRRTRRALSGWASTTSICCWCTGRIRTKIVTSMHCGSPGPFWTAMDSAP